jgi:hypothetical protein
MVLSVLLAVSGCSLDSPPEQRRTPTQESAALRVRTVSGAERLDAVTRTRLEGAVGDVLSSYVVGAFLGRFPREDFVQSFASFTSGAARAAAGDIDQLTAAQVHDAASVRATRLDARLSFFTQGGSVHGATAAVHFAFEATMGDGSTRPLVLDGRLMLEDAAGTWSVFGYDVALDDGATVTTESSP